MKNNSELLDNLILKMIEFDKGDPKRIQHFVKVHAFARLIGVAENISEEELFVLEAAAIVHDIGIIPSEKKYGKCDGKLQEKEGPFYAEQLLNDLNFSDDVIKRVSFLVAHHHTYSNITGNDYRILVEADFIVNLFEDDLSKEAAKSALQNIFRTQTGTSICKTMFGI